MRQGDLLQVKIDEWEDNGWYDQLFRLSLTTKHQLVVGRWEKDGQWGVDLRRWSYHQARLLHTKGITLFGETWDDLHSNILTLHKDGKFRQFGDVDEDEYVGIVEYTFIIHV